MKAPYYIDCDNYLNDEETELSACLDGMSEETQRLIAAAPDMLEALQLCLDRLEINNCDSEEDEYIQQVQNAIVLATGQAAGSSGEVDA